MKEFDTIVVDNGSTDGSVELLEMKLPCNDTIHISRVVHPVMICKMEHFTAAREYFRAFLHFQHEFFYREELEKEREI